MREHKYRVWDKKQERMITHDKSVGWLYGIQLGGELMEYWPRLENPTWPTRPYEAHHREVTDKFILMQYIGRKDKKSKEIYEADIYHDKVYGTRVIFYCTQDARFASRRWEKDATAYPYDWSKIEIIGNVYKNPELLEK